MQSFCALSRPVTAGSVLLSASRFAGAMMRLLGILIVVARAAPAPASAAGFDCARAARPDEIAVCADPALSDLDSLATKAYADARIHADTGEKSSLLSDARTFLARRGRCGSNVACLFSAYAGALQDFQGHGSSVEVPSSLSALDMVGAVPAESRAMPVREGDCTQSRITLIGGRLEGDTTFESGTTVVFANGGHQVSYEKLPGIVGSRRGDPVLMCLTSIPKRCPPGDDRGRFYVTTNLRTRATWSAPDSQHMCGGA